MSIYVDYGGDERLSTIPRLNLETRRCGNVDVTLAPPMSYKICSTTLTTSGATHHQWL